MTVGQALIRSRIQARCLASFGVCRAPIRLGLTDPVFEWSRARLITLDAATRNTPAAFARKHFLDRPQTEVVISMQIAKRFLPR